MFATWLFDVVDLMLPIACAGCGRPGPALCAVCRGGGTVRLDVGGSTALPAVAAGAYEAGLRHTLLAYKERGRRDLAGPLADLLRTALARLDPPAPHLLVPVPSSARARRTRGGDHVRALARRVGPTRCVLSLVRDVADSAGLLRGERAANLAGAMRAGSRGLGGPPVVLVDDIVTTGTTLREAARALAASGWEVAGAVAIAATPRRPAG